MDDVYGMIHLVPDAHRISGGVGHSRQRVGANRAANAGTIRLGRRRLPIISQRPPADHDLLPKKCWHAGLEQGSMNLSRDGTRAVPNDDWTLLIGPAVNFQKPRAPLVAFEGCYSRRDPVRRV